MVDVYVGDVGTEIVLDCGVNISNAMVRNVVARKPSGKQVIWAGVLEGTNFIKYTTLAGDIDEAGQWKLQSQIEMPGWKGSGAITKMTVNNPI